jgi:carbamoyltransferase
MTDKPTVTLGIHDGLMAAAALVVDGQLRAACAEERLTRQKNQSGIPLRAIETVLATEGLSIDDVDVIAPSTRDAIIPTIDDMPTSQTTGRFFDAYGLGGSLLASIERRWPATRALTVPSDFARRLGRPLLQRTRAAAISAATGANVQRMVSYDHHTAHVMALAAVPGPERQLAFTLDGEGDGLSGSVAWYRAGQPPERIGSVSRNASLGHIYAGVTGHLRMASHQDEFKVMGMAPYAHASARDACRDRLRSLLWVERDSSGTPNITSSRGTRLAPRFIGDYVRDFRFDAQCAGVQQLCEETILEWTTAWVEHLGLDRDGVDIGLGGGVFMNVKANMRIAQQAWANTVTPVPSCGDESCAVGAAFLAYMDICAAAGREAQFQRTNDLYLGPAWSDADIEHTVDRASAAHGLHVERPTDIADRTAELLAEGHVVARFRGRMEWGARALGNRSILADPSRHDSVREINKRIKSRDFWMPFAATILAEAASTYLQAPPAPTSPHMMLAFETVPDRWHEIAAGTHPYDRTCRAQILERRANPEYHRLIERFRDRTGIGAVLNTSLNLHGDPMVNSPDDALRTLLESDLAFLTLEDFLISKPTAA